MSHVKIKYHIHKKNGNGVGCDCYRTNIS